jgi:predicted Zn-dependent peptidase
MYELSALDNGLRILTVTMPHLKSVSLGFFVGVGSRYECETMSGASHFIEHMLFKGTDRRPTAHEIAESIEGKGGMFNASTSLEATLYWAKVAQAHLPETMDVLSDMLLHATFDQNEIDKERSVIGEEISFSMESPESLAQLRVNDMMWPNHPLGRDVAGTTASVAGLSRDDLLGFLSDHYRPGSTILGVAGNIGHETVVDLAEEHLGHWQPGPAMTYEPAPPPPKLDGPNVHTEFKETEQAQLSLSFSGMSREDPDRYALRVLNIILGEGMRSRLFQEIRERLGLAYLVGSYVTALQDTGAVGAYAGVAADRTEDAVRAILNQMDLMRWELVPDKELKSAREFIRGRTALSMEDPFALAAWYARQELLEAEVVDPETALGLIDSVEAEDVQRVARMLFSPDRLHLAVVGPFSENGNALRRAAAF